MRTRIVEERIGENMGPVDWSHPIAKNMPPIWREAEKNPEGFVFSEHDRMILDVAMYDGWPYWTPRPAVHVIGVLGPEWHFFDSYGVHADSIKPKRTRGYQLGLKLTSGWQAGIDGRSPPGRRPLPYCGIIAGTDPLLWNLIGLAAGKFDSLPR